MRYIKNRNTEGKKKEKEEIQRKITKENLLKKLNIFATEKKNSQANMYKKLCF